MWHGRENDVAYGRLPSPTLSNIVSRKNFKGTTGVVSSDPPFRESHVGFTVWYPCNLHLSKNKKDILVFLSYVMNSDYFLYSLENCHFN